MFCGKCGHKMGDEGRFCRSCGALADDAEANGYPAGADVVAAPTRVSAPTAVTPLALPQLAPQPMAAKQSRPAWLLPALAAAAIVVVLAVAVAVVVVSRRGSGPAPLAEQAVPVLAPINADLGLLSDALARAKTQPALADAAAAAAQLRRDAAQATGQVQTLKLPSGDASAGPLLTRALTAATDFARQTEAAARDPRPGTLGPARNAGDAARTAFGSLAAALPALTLPQASQFSVQAIDAIATAKLKQQQSAADAKAKLQQNATDAKTGARSYVQRIDRLLANSADTRTNLGNLINSVTSGSMTPTEAKSQIAATINQRQDLQNAIAAVDAPPPFAAAAQLLRESLTASISDDLAIQGWIDAWISQDQPTYDSFWQQHLAATANATSRKQTFVAAYNNLRKRTLALGPLAVGDNY